MPTLYEQPEAFIVHSESAPALQIDRVSGLISAASADIAKLARAGPGRPIVGVLGTLQLKSVKVLIVATDSERVGDLFGHAVFKITGTDVISYRPSLSNEDDKFIGLLNQHLASAPLFYSLTWDLTNSLQRQAESKTVHKYIWQGADNRFFWNWTESQDLINAGDAGAPYVLPVMFGVYSIASLRVNNVPIEFGIVTRRSRFRAGTRYFRRGLDAEGHAANFNETEQILSVDGQRYSFVQTRGSVPAYWGEINYLRYRPILMVGGKRTLGVDAAAKHFTEQKKIYGKQFLVNLVNQTGYEKRVKDAYESVVQALNDPDLEYVYFDFHHECSKMRWHRVQLLLDALDAAGLGEQKWFASKDNGRVIVNTQSSVVRTNCMDCLDRTNVVQSCLGLEVLKKQLTEAGVLQPGGDIAHDPVFLGHFRAVWADNADGVSKAYSGTGALKTDFTRTGKRTREGAFRDFVNSVTRFYLNNLRDGPRQDAFSLFTGDYDALSNTGTNPFADRASLGEQSVPYVLAGSLFVFIVSLVSPSPRYSRTTCLLISLVFGFVALRSLLYILKNGLQYVNWPRLVPLDYVKYTPGRGYSLPESDSKQE